MIKKLKVSEIPLLREIATEFSEFADYPGGFNFEYSASVWVNLLTSGMGELFVAWEGQRIIGMLGCAFLNDPFSGNLTALEQVWYVLPAFRHGKLGLSLWFAFEREAAARGCTNIVMVHLTTEKEDTMTELYQRRGYRRIEQTFRKEI